jgi:hypothetical protein
MISTEIDYLFGDITQKNADEIIILPLKKGEESQVYEGNDIQPEEGLSNELLSQL